MRVGREPDRGPRRGLRRRAEDVEVDPGMDDLDPAGLGVVQVDQLLGLGVGVGDQHVGGLDDLLLTDHPGRRLGGVAVGQGAFLTFAIVCIECTSGTPQRSRASAPTWPESQ